MTMITPSYLGETIEYSSLHACRSTLEDPTLFTHTFAFGLLARMDATSRAVAATPAMLMTGSAVGPILGGVLVQRFGYESLGFAVIVIATMGVVCFSRVGSDPTAAHSPRAAI